MSGAGPKSKFFLDKRTLVNGQKSHFQLDNFIDLNDWIRSIISDSVKLKVNNNNTVTFQNNQYAITFPISGLSIADNNNNTYTVTFPDNTTLLIDAQPANLEIQDVGNYYISTNVEDALQELGQILQNLSLGTGYNTIEYNNTPLTNRTTFNISSTGGLIVSDDNPDTKLTLHQNIENLVTLDTTINDPLPKLGFVTSDFTNPLSPVYQIVQLGTTPNEVTISDITGQSNATIGLSNIGTAGTYTKVTTDSKGRVTSGQSQILWSDIQNPNEPIQDMISSFLIAGNYITLNYDDGANTLEIIAQEQPRYMFVEDVHNNSAEATGGETLTFVSNEPSILDILVIDNDPTFGDHVLFLFDQTNIDHHQLTNYFPDEHIDHSVISVNAGLGLTGGGTIDHSITLDVVPDTTRQLIQVQDNNVVIATRSKLDFIAGSGISINVADEPLQQKVQITITNTGGGIGGGGITNAYDRIWDGTNVATASASDKIMFRSNDNSISVLVGSNHPTYNDYVDLQLSSTIQSTIASKLGPFTPNNAGAVIAWNGTNWITVKRQTYTGYPGTGNTINLAYTPITYMPLDVYYNGIIQEIGVDYTISSNQLTFTNNFVATDKITANFYIFD